MTTEPPGTADPDPYAPNPRVNYRFKSNKSFELKVNDTYNNNVLVTNEFPVNTSNQQSELNLTNEY